MNCAVCGRVVVALGPGNLAAWHERNTGRVVGAVPVEGLTPFASDGGAYVYEVCPGSGQPVAGVPHHA